MSAQSYRGVLEHLYLRAGAGIKLGLGPMRQLLDALGAPDRGMPFVVVAGTNGKGSTSLQIAAALRQAGHRVGLYTSPHLMRFAERIRLGEGSEWQEIDEEEVVAAYAAMAAVEARCERPPTYFEAVTAMALLHFQAARADVVVLEVGLGGRLDATNVVDRVLSVITPIGMDHMHQLGDTLEEIAEEKAGIIEPGRPVVLAQQQPSVRQVLLARARAAGAERIWATPPRRDGDVLVLEAGVDTLRLSRRPPGGYQEDNLATSFAASRALDRLGIACPPTAYAAAVADLVWPGRYQWAAPDVLVDAAHNPHGLSALLASLPLDPQVAGRPVHVVFSALRDKPVEPMLAALRTFADDVAMCPLELRRGLTPSEIAAIAPDLPTHPDVASALTAARTAAAADGGVVLVTGSIFLIADAMTILTGAERDPPVPY